MKRGPNKQQYNTKHAKIYDTENNKHLGLGFLETIPSPRLGFLV